MSEVITSHHEPYMRRCIELAQIAKDAGDAPVGSLIVCSNKVIAEGFEEVKSLWDVAGHAEIVTIRRACRFLRSLDLSGCTLYTSAEPCFMCSYAIRQTRISEVVMGTRVDEVGGSSSAHPILTIDGITKWASPPRIVESVLQDECEALRKP